MLIYIICPYYRQMFFAQVGSAELPYLDKELHRGQITQFPEAWRCLISYWVCQGRPTLLYTNTCCQSRACLFIQVHIVILATLAQLK